MKFENPISRILIKKSILFWKFYKWFLQKKINFNEINYIIRFRNNKLFSFWVDPLRVHPVILIIISSNRIISLLKFTTSEKNAKIINGEFHWQYFNAVKIKKLVCWCWKLIAWKSDPTAKSARKKFAARKNSFKSFKARVRNFLQTVFSDSQSAFIYRP